MNKRQHIVVAFVAAITAAIFAATPAWAVQPGSVSPIINTTAGSGQFSYHAVAAGWYRGAITVSYTIYDGPSATGPWAIYDSDSHSCASSTSCSTATRYGVCSEGYYKLVAYASGPGGAAENNGASKVVHVYGTWTASPPAASTASWTAMVPAGLSSECKVHNEPI